MAAPRLLGTATPYPSASLKIIALLAWFDEAVDLLDRYVRSLAGIAVDHLIAVDGRYALYPDLGGRVRSPIVQGDAIRAACRDVGIPLVLVPACDVWPTEAEKRTFMFTLANRIAHRNDWFLVLDADVRIRTTPTDLRTRLSFTDHDVGLIRVHDTFLADCPYPGFKADMDLRALFRAQPIRVVGDHTTYVTHENRVLWSEPRKHQQVPALDLRDKFIVDHFPYERSAARNIAKQNYYLLRDDVRAEDFTVVSA